ncbi:MAG: hypothetical protein WKF50_08315 [Nocardioides sp.]
MAPPDPAYGHEHQVRKTELLPFAYNTPCPRCGKIMLRGQELQLGHSEDLALNPYSKGDQIEHADCNQSAGGKLGARQLKFKPSRKW